MALRGFRDLSDGRDTKTHALELLEAFKQAKAQAYAWGWDGGMTTVAHANLRDPNGRVYHGGFFAVRWNALEESFAHIQGLGDLIEVCQVDEFPGMIAVHYKGKGKSAGIVYAEYTVNGGVVSFGANKEEPLTQGEWQRVAKAKIA